MKNSEGTQRAKTSRIQARSEAVPQAKNTGQQGEPIAVNREYLERIKVLSERNETENYDFRAWLNNYAPGDIDDVVKALSQKYFALIASDYGVSLTADVRDTSPGHIYT